MAASLVLDSIAASSILELQVFATCGPLQLEDDIDGRTVHQWSSVVPV